MKYYLLATILAFFTFTMDAQLYVQPTATDASYVYANDTFIYVTGDIELKENTAGVTNEGAPSIALRNQSQILQGTNTSLNKGDGEISIFQEGTTNNYDYNFWASPVGVAGVGAATEADGNSSFSMIGGEETLHLPTDVLESNPALNASGFDGSVTLGGLFISNFWLWSYQSTTTTSGSTNASWTPVQNSNRLSAGWGFSMKGVSGTDTTTAGESTPNNNGDNTDGEGQRYDFRGRPNNGTITGVRVGLNENSLIGNPYPSALDLSYFLIENSGSGTVSYDCAETGTNATITRNGVTTGVAYFWESDPNVFSHTLQDYQGGYGTFSPMGTTCTTGMYVAATYLNYDNLGGTEGTAGTGDGTLRRRFSPVGQGFFVTGDAGQTTDVINFNNEQRVYVPEGAANNSQFKNSENTETVVPGIAINRKYDDVRNLPQVSHIKLAVGVNDTYTRQLALGFVDNATQGVDKAIDASNRGPLATDVSFDIDGALGTDKENGFVINGVPYDENQLVPLMIKAESTTEFKFKVFESVDFPYSEVLLYDAETDTYHDILYDEAFLLLEEDFYTDRFYIRFTKESLGEETTEEEEETTNEEETENEEESENEESEETSEEENESEETSENEEDTNTEDESEETTNEDTTEEESTEETETTIENDPYSVEEVSPFLDESILESFTIVQNNANRQLEIYNPQNIEVSDITLFDLTGKKVFNQMNMGGQSEYKFPTGNLSTGVYVVQFVTKSGLRKGRKVSIVN